MSRVRVLLALVVVGVVVCLGYVRSGWSEERSRFPKEPGPAEIQGNPFWVQLPNLPVKVPAIYAGDEPRRPWPEALVGGRLGGSTQHYSMAVLHFSNPEAVARQEDGKLLMALQGKTALVRPPTWFSVGIPGYDYAQLDLGGYDENERLWRMTLAVYGDGKLKKEFPFVSPNSDVYTYSGIFYLQKGRT